MSLFAALLDPGFRQAASLLIEVGTARQGIGELAALVSAVEVQTGRIDAATDALVARGLLARNKAGALSITTAGAWTGAAAGTSLATGTS